VCAQLSDRASLLGRGWTIIKGGNRVIQPMRAVVATGYGDWSSRVDRCSAGLRSSLKQYGDAISAESANCLTMLSLIGAGLWKFFSEYSPRRGML
jgi:hypothetical protein